MKKTEEEKQREPSTAIDDSLKAGCGTNLKQKDSITTTPKKREKKRQRNLISAP